MHPKYDAFRRTVAVAVGDRLTDLANFQPLLGHIWTGLDSENVSLLREQTIYLPNCGASEAQWDQMSGGNGFLKEPNSPHDQSYPPPKRTLFGLYKRKWFSAVDGEEEYYLHSLQAARIGRNPAGPSLKHPGIRT